MVFLSVHGESMKLFNVLYYQLDRYRSSESITINMVVVIIRLTTKYQVYS